MRRGLGSGISNQLHRTATVSLRVTLSYQGSFSAAPPPSLPGLPALHASPDSQDASEPALGPPEQGACWLPPLLSDLRTLIEPPTVRACGPTVGAAAQRAPGSRPGRARESGAASGRGASQGLDPPKERTLRTSSALRPRRRSRAGNPSVPAALRQGHSAELLAGHECQVARARLRPGHRRGGVLEG